MTAEDYLKDRLQEQFTWYEGKAAWNQRWYKRLRLLEIVCAALVPVLTTASTDAWPVGKWLAAALGIVIAVAAATQALHGFHENWIRYRGTAEQLKQERFRYLSATGTYADEATRDATLVDRVEAILSSEFTHWTTVTRQDAPGAPPAPPAPPAPGAAPAESSGPAG